MIATLILIFALYQQPTTAVTLSPDQPAIVMPREDALAMFDRLAAKRHDLTAVEQKWYAALIVGLGVFPPSDTYLDCSGLSFTERMRTEMGSSYHLGKCVQRSIKQ